jgi:uncharacterized Tic20 family protein
METAQYPVGSNDKLLAILCHISSLFGMPIILPLVLFLAKKGEPGSSLGEIAREVLNFHLSLLIYALVSLPLCLILIGFLLLWGLGFFTLIMAIVAAIKCSDGYIYRYPLCLRLVR